MITFIGSISKVRDGVISDHARKLNCWLELCRYQAGGSRFTPLRLLCFCGEILLTPSIVNEIQFQLDTLGARSDNQYLFSTISRDRKGGRGCSTSSRNAPIDSALDVLVNLL